MKKIFSFILALTMVCTMFAFTVEAGTNGSYVVTYTAVSEGADVTALKEGDIFLANFVLTGAEGYFGSKIVVSWNSNVIVPCKTDGTLVTALTNTTQQWTQTTANRVDANKSYVQDDPEYYYYDEETGEETIGREIAAFGYQERAISSSSLTYATVPTTSYTSGAATQDYLLDGDLNIISVRFKVVGTGSAALSIDSNQTQETKADGDVRTANVSVPAITVVSDEEEVTYAPKTFTVDFEYGTKAEANTGLALNFKQVDAENVTKEDTVDVPFTSMVGADFEAPMDVVLGVTVNDVPSNVTLTLEGADWYLAE